jgi:hypothetical protein
VVVGQVGRYYNHDMGWPSLARSLMWTIFSSTLWSLESLPKPTGWSGWERRWFKGVLRITDDTYCACPCIFLKSEKLISSGGGQSSGDVAAVLEMFVLRYGHLASWSDTPHHLDAQEDFGWFPSGVSLGQFLFRDAVFASLVV